MKVIHRKSAKSAKSQKKSLKSLFLRFCVFSVFAVFFAVYGVCLAEEPYTLDDIVVEAPQEGITTYTISGVSGKNLDSLDQALTDAGGVDLRYRAPSIQGDLSVRGSTFEQVGVYLDGLKINDPQTGHYNLDIPLTTYDVDKIEVSKDGFGGINIITKKPKQKKLNLDATFGEHALFGQLFSLSYPTDKISSRVSFEHKIAKAARPNTDFEYQIASLFLGRKFQNSDLNLNFGYQKKDYGADSFYSSSFPEEEEHTETLFGRVGLDTKIDTAILKNNFYLRKHRDKFILKRNLPSTPNYHTTYVYGWEPEFRLPTSLGEFIFGLGLANDQINSTNLGKHARFHQAGSLGLNTKIGDKFDTSLEAGVDNYQKWGLQESYNFVVSYKIKEEKLKLKGAVSRNFRIPSFTELYYSDAANVGNDQLKAEKADTYSLGLSSKLGKVSLAANAYLRKGHNLIDWTKQPADIQWQATNLGSVDFRGLELSAKLKNYTFSYNYLSPDKDESGFLSKYALDVLQHQYLIDVPLEYLGFNFSMQLSYNQRYYNKAYFLGNLYIGRKIRAGSMVFEPYVKIDNFSDSTYREIAGVLQPGRWVKSGLKFEW